MANATAVKVRREKVLPFHMKLSNDSHLIWMRGVVSICLFELGGNVRYRNYDSNGRRIQAHVPQVRPDRSGITFCFSIPGCLFYRLNFLLCFF